MTVGKLYFEFLVEFLRVFIVRFEAKLGFRSDLINVVETNKICLGVTVSTMGLDLEFTPSRCKSVSTYLNNLSHLFFGP